MSLNIGISIANLSTSIKSIKWKHPNRVNPN